MHRLERLFSGWRNRNQPPVEASKCPEKDQFDIQKNVDIIVQAHPGLTQIRIVADELSEKCWLQIDEKEKAGMNYVIGFPYHGDDEIQKSIFQIGRFIRYTMNFLNTAVIVLDEEGKITSITPSVDRTICR